MVVYGIMIIWSGNATFFQNIHIPKIATRAHPLDSGFAFFLLIFLPNSVQLCMYELFPTILNSYDLPVILQSLAERVIRTIKKNVANAGQECVMGNLLKCISWKIGARFENKKINKYICSYIFWSVRLCKIWICKWRGRHLSGAVAPSLSYGCFALEAIQLPLVICSYIFTVIFWKPSRQVFRVLAAHAIQ